MSPHLNTRARLNRAIRNNQKIYSAWETFRRFRFFTLSVVCILPIYPTLSALGSGYDIQADYDESTIITAYTDDSLEGSAYIGENGMISTDFDTSTPVVATRSNPSAMTTAHTHVVQTGETAGAIAAKYGVSTETVLWANNLTASDGLTAGQTLKIPPVSGVVHIVQKGDTLSHIAVKYGVDIDDILRVNNLTADMAIRDGIELMIPGAAKPVEPVPAAQKPEEKQNTPAKTSTQSTPKKTTASNASAESSTTTVSATVNANGLKDRYAVKYTGNARGFVWGNCTAYVAMNKTVTWRGNANQWIKNARAQGVPTGSTAVIGSIIQFSGHGYNPRYGHVGIVADITDDYIIVKDMNYRALNEVTIRKVPKNDPAIDGYIYVD